MAAELGPGSVQSEYSPGFAHIARVLTGLYKDYFDTKTRLQRRVADYFKIQAGRKLEAVTDMSFSNLKDVVEFQAKRRMSLAEQDEWKPYFKSNVAELRKLCDQIDSSEVDLDEKIFRLYRIADEERAVIEKTILHKPI